MAVTCPHLCQHLLRVGQCKGVPAGAAAMGCRPQGPGRLADRRRLCGTLCLARHSWLHAPPLRCRPVRTQVLRFLASHCAVGSSCLYVIFSSRQALLSSHTEGRPYSALLGPILARVLLCGCLMVVPLRSHSGLGRLARVLFTAGGTPLPCRPSPCWFTCTRA